MDFTDELEQFLLLNKREDDGKLHCSSALTDNLRHVQLGAVNAPSKAEDLMSLVRMNTGTLWHEWLDRMFNDSKYLVETEVKLDSNMHHRWSGTCDMLIRDNDTNEWHLYDYKVVNPMSLPWVQRSGGKIDHKWQVSAYYYAARDYIKGKFDEVLSPDLAVVYLPAFTDNKVSAPFIAQFLPIDQATFTTERDARTALVDAYAAEYATNLKLINEVLVEADLYEYKERKGKVVRLPHWRSRFCPYVNETEGGVPICGCDRLSQKTLGPTEQWGHMLTEGI